MIINGLVCSQSFAPLFSSPIPFPTSFSLFISIEFCMILFDWGVAPAPVRIAIFSSFFCFFFCFDFFFVLNCRSFNWVWILFGFPDCFRFNHDPVAVSRDPGCLSTSRAFPFPEPEKNKQTPFRIYHNYAIATAVLRGPPCTCRHPGLHESYLYHALLARMYTQTCCFRNQGTFVLFAPFKPPRFTFIHPVDGYSIITFYISLHIYYSLSSDFPDGNISIHSLPPIFINFFVFKLRFFFELGIRVSPGVGIHFPLLFTLNMFDSSSAINHLEYIN